VNSSTLKVINHQFDVALPATHRLNYYTACIEGEGGYVKQHPFASIEAGSVYGNAIITGSNAADGTGTTPSNLSTTEQWETFLQANWPLTADDIAEIDTLYPAEDFTTSHLRGTILYQDVIFACPATILVQSFAKKGSGAYRYMFAVPPASHAQDNAYEFSIWYQHLSPVSPTFFASYTGEITSFIRTLNPNVVRPPLSDSLQWPLITTKDQETKIFNITQSSSGNLTVASLEPVNATLTGTTARCDFWTKTRLREGW